jgi:3-phenylpropionate/trans-cinnamate dioxygenase ferredoxin reductase subunit
MNHCDFLLIGGGVASYNAAKKIRRARSDARIVMVASDPLPPYDLPPLSKEFLRAEKTEADLIYPRLESVEMLTSAAVASLDAEAHRARLVDGREYEFTAALLATGSSPIELLVPGAELQGVHYLRSAQDGRRIAAAATPGKRAVVIGAGFIGLEITASLTTMGVSVTVVEALDRVWPRFADTTVAGLVSETLVARGVRLLTGDRVVQVSGQGRVASVVTASGEVLPCDFVIVGIGIRPNVELARNAGLAVDNGIVVDDGMRASVAGIFAAGDAVNYPDPIAGARLRAEHWGHAEYSGQLAGANMCGGDGRYVFMHYAWSDVFDLHIESAGYIEGYDEVIVRGQLADRSFTALYLRQGALVAYCAVNREPVEFATFRRLIRNRQKLGPIAGELRHAGVSLKELLGA